MVPTKFFEIPELVTALLTFLSKSDLTRLMQVNHILHNACEPLFWQSVDLEDRNRTLRFLKSPEAISAMSRNAHLIKSLGASNDFFIYYMHGLLSRQIPDSTTPEEVKQVDPPSWLPDYAIDKDSFVPLPFFSNLTRFRFKIHGKREYFSWGEEPPLRGTISADGVPDLDTLHVVWILSCHPNVHRVCIDNVEFRNWYIAKAIAKTLESLGKLTHLELISHRFTYCPAELRMMFQSCPPTIESFKLHGSIRTTRVPSEARVKDHMFKEPENEIVLNPRTEPLLNLKEMALPRLDSPKSFYAESITEIMKRCPALEKWTFIDFARHDANMAMDEMFSNTCRKVRHIYVPEQHYAFDISTQARLYTSLPPNNLESIHWENFQYHKTHAFEFDADPSYDGMKEILQHHSKSLKMIQLNVSDGHFRGSDGVTIGSTLKKILGTCEALESLIVTQKRNRQDGFLEDLIESEWVCHGLNHLELYFTLSEDDGDGGDGGDHDENSKCQAVTKNNVLLDRLYSQIGRMSSLKVLDLKHEVFREYSEPEVKYYSVPLPRLLTLKDDKETGAAGCLSMLEGLTELRELRGSVRVDVAKVSNSMGQQEVEWMLKHWPNLRLAEFLPDNYDSIVGFEMPEHLKWLKDQKPGLRLSLK